MTVDARDDLGHPVDRGRAAQRVVSLVPSLTEAIAVTRPETLIGATEWCTHTAGLHPARVRGTKNPDRAAIAALEPDVVLANREENRELDIRKLRDAGIAVWVTVIETVDEAFASMQRMFTAGLGWDVPPWLDEARDVWSLPAVAIGTRVAIPIWRDPWMVVGSRTFAGDVVSRLGLVNAFASHPERYPHVELTDIDRDDVNLVLLPDEPYVFTEQDGPECFARTPTALVSGRALTWYGPSMLTARAELEAALG